MSRTLPRPVLVPLIVACALFMENLDSTVLSTALPAIARSFEVNPLRLSLAITAYLFSLAVFIPISGWVADRFGARRVFRAAILVFMLGSILCGLSQSVPMLLLARVFQGLGGAMMVPVGRLVLLRSVERSELIRAMAYLTVPALFGPIMGPPLGGFITTYLSWRWIFWINIPIGLLGIVLVTLFIEEVREDRPPPLDIRGFLLAAVGLTGLVAAFEIVGRGMLPPGGIALLFAIGAGGIALYIRHARRTAHPVIDLSLLEVPTFRAAIIGGFLFRIGIGAIPFLLPLMLQVGFGKTAFESGMLTFASAAGSLAMKLSAGPILKRFGFRPVLIGNALISAAFLATYGLFRPDTAAWVILSLLLVGGFFRSLQFTSVNVLAFADLPRERMSRATSFTGMCQQLSLSIGVGSGALFLQLALLLHGEAGLAVQDFATAFLGVAVIAALSMLAYLPLPPDAGSEVSGRIVRRAVPESIASTPPSG